MRFALLILLISFSLAACSDDDDAQPSSTEATPSSTEDPVTGEVSGTSATTTPDPISSTPTSDPSAAPTTPDPSETTTVTPVEPSSDETTVDACDNLCLEGEICLEDEAICVTPCDQDPLLLVCMHFDRVEGDAVLDGSVNEQNATLIEGAQVVRDEVHGSYLLLEQGEREEREAPNHLAFDEVLNIEGDATIFLRFRLDAVIEESYIDILSSYEAGGYWFGAYYEEDDYPHYVEWWGNNTMVMDESPWTLGEWIQYALVFDSDEGELRIYREGVLMNTNDTPFSDFDSVTEPLLLGYGAEDVAMTGAISELRIWNKLFSEEELCELAGSTWISDLPEESQRGSDDFSETEPFCLSPLHPRW